MKTIKVTSLIICVLFSYFSLKAQTETVQENLNAPVISFDKTTHDYGIVKKGSDGTYEFKFTNTGKEPLILSNVRSSCGCTVPTWPKEPILPGKSETIRVVYNTQIVGNINKSVTIMSNAKTDMVTLNIRGTVEE